MKALVCRKLGDPLKEEDVLVVSHDRERVQLSAMQVRIRVAAAALNFADVLQVQGLYQEKPALPFVPGGEVSGHVIEIGSSVKTLTIGAKVCAITLEGALAEEVVVDEQQVLQLGGVRDLEAAAGLPVAFGTSHLAICERAKLRAGQTILILGAAGGVGLAAVQIAKLKGATVVAVARGQEKGEVLRNLGANVVIDTSINPQKPLRQLIKESAPRGVDVVLDLVGGKPFEESLKCVSWGAHLLIIGFATGSIPKIAANIILVKNLTVHGIYWGSYMQHHPAMMQKGLREVAQWLSEGKISVPSSQRYPLEQAKEGFRDLKDRKAIGKVLILPFSSASKL